MALKKANFKSLFFFKHFTVFFKKRKNVKMSELSLISTKGNFTGSPPSKVEPFHLGLDSSCNEQRET